LEIINRSLVHIQTSRTLGRIHRIGDHELRWADYQLVCAWAEELGLSPVQVLDKLMRGPQNGTTIENGKFKNLYVDRSIISVSFMPSIQDLNYQKLTVSNGEDAFVFEPGPRPMLVDLSCDGFELDNLNNLSAPNLNRLKCGIYSWQLIGWKEERMDSGITTKEVDFSIAPNLKVLDCSGNDLSSIDLSGVPDLEILTCGGNYLEMINLSAVPKLKILQCPENELADLNLSSVPELTKIECSGNKISNLNLSRVPKLSELDCQWNRLENLDLTHVPNLEVLLCQQNLIGSLDLSPVGKLRCLYCYFNKFDTIDVRSLKYLQRLESYLPQMSIIRRPDQKFI
jgi:Leucine-rich repeat (LRR) protein